MVCPEEDHRSDCESDEGVAEDLRCFAWRCVGTWAMGTEGDPVGL